MNERFIKPFARLVPAEKQPCRGDVLAKLIAGNELSPEDARAWYRDLESARKDLQPPRREGQ